MGSNDASLVVVSEEESYTPTQGLVMVIIDQGTTSSRVVAIDATLEGHRGNMEHKSRILATHAIDLETWYPSPGWVEQDANEMLQTVLICLRNVATKLTNLGYDIKRDVVGLAIANQRETTVAWDRKTSVSLAPVIVWSDTRTANLVEELTKKTATKQANAFQDLTGLPISSYFSGFKIRWLLDNVDAVAKASTNMMSTDNGELSRLAVGTVDSWLIWCLTKGEHHVTDITNASRTFLFNINTLQWDPFLCNFMGVPMNLLPTIRSSAEFFGRVNDQQCPFFGLPIYGVLGDQQAALVGHTWPGAAKEAETDDPILCSECSDTIPISNLKVTYGTGAFLLWNVGTEPIFSTRGLLTTIAHQMGPNVKPTYALEGAVAYAGGTMTYLRDKLGMFSSFDGCEQIANKAHDLDPDREVDYCYLVPAFSGLFCPYWSEGARACLVGLTAGCDRSQIALAGLRASAYQTRDLLDAVTPSCPKWGTVTFTRLPRLLKFLPNNSLDVLPSYMVLLWRPVHCIAVFISYLYDYWWRITGNRDEYEEPCTNKDCPQRINAFWSWSKSTVPKAKIIAVDGGQTQSRLLMQSVADITGTIIERPANADLITALGAGVAAAIGAGISPAGLIKLRESTYGVSRAVSCASVSSVLKGQRLDETKALVLRPNISPLQQASLCSGWDKAVSSALLWNKLPRESSFCTMLAVNWTPTLALVTSLVVIKYMLYKAPII